MMLQSKMAWMSHIKNESSDIMVSSEYFTLILILLSSTKSLAPVTTQYPGDSSGPLTISFVSTKFDIFGGLAGVGVVISKEISPDLRVELIGSSHSDLRIVADATIENPSLRNRTFFMPIAFTSNQALVAIEAKSSIRVPWHSIGAVQTCENMLHFTGSK
nr:hypothetical protein Iba_chr14aCG3080 [Ipomoea batatas]